MPAHESATPAPPTDIDIDSEVDVIFDEPGEGEATELAIDHDAPAPPFQTPVPGEHLMASELAEDLAEE